MTLITRGVRQMLRQRRQKPQQDFKRNDFFLKKLIVVATARNQDTLNIIFQNGGEETIREMTIQKALEHGNREKQQVMII